MTQPITNPANQIALKIHPPHQVLAQHTPTGSDYLFTIRANIALSWVNEADVNNLLNRKKKGCCGAPAYRYLYANEDDVRRWSNGGGR